MDMVKTNSVNYNYTPVKYNSQLSVSIEVLYIYSM